MRLPTPGQTRPTRPEPDPSARKIAAPGPSARPRKTWRPWSQLAPWRLGTSRRAAESCLWSVEWRPAMFLAEKICFFFLGLTPWLWVGRDFYPPLDLASAKMLDILTSLLCLTLTKNVRQAMDRFAVTSEIIGISDMDTIWYLDPKNTPKKMVKVLNITYDIK